MIGQLVANQVANLPAIPPAGQIAPKPQTGPLIPKSGPTAPVPTGSPFSQATQNYRNEGYTGGAYRRFDPNDAQAALWNVKKPALAFDQLYGSPWVPRATVPQQQFAGFSQGRGGLGGAAYDAMTRSGFITPQSQQAIDYNARFDRFGPAGVAPQLDEYEQRAFASQGLDQNDIASLQAINALDPNTKANVIANIQQQKQLKNQRAKRGMGGPLGLALGLSSLIGGIGGFGLLPSIAGTPGRIASIGTGIQGLT